MLHDTFERQAGKIGVSDFSPSSQDRLAVELLISAGAIEALEAGDFDAALRLASGYWASLPKGFGKLDTNDTKDQPYHRYDDISSFYRQQLSNMEHVVRKFFIAILALFICLISVQLANAKDIKDQKFPTIRDGTLYGTARKALIKAGNIPVHQMKRQEPACDSIRGVCKKYPETLICAVDQFAPCTMVWRTRDGAPFYIRTYGNELRNIRVFRSFPGTY